MSASVDCHENHNELESNKRAHEPSSEDNKLEISNLPKRMNFYVIKQLVERQLGINAKKIKVGFDNAYLAFETAQERDAALVKISGVEYRGRTLEAKIATPRPDLFIKRAKTTTGTDDGENEQTESASDRDVNLRVCPLYDKPYEEQLRIKDTDMRSVLKIGKQLLKINKNLRDDATLLYDWTQRNQKLCCDYSGVVASPSIKHYRNKCEFNVSKDGSIGFKMGRFKNGDDRVVFPPSDCPIVTPMMLDILSILKDMLTSNESKSLKPFDPATHEGNVRQVTIRKNENEQYLVIVDIHPQNLTDDELENALNDVAEALKPKSGIQSIYVNLSTKHHLTSNDTTLKLIYGQSHIEETLVIEPDRPLNFRIAPLSFFQVNTKAAELLYKSIIDLADLNENSLVLDVGCGTGTIGLSLAHKVDYVIGIEVVETAVADAKINAERNGIKNISFFAGRAEDLINESLAILRNKQQDKKGEIVAIVDPPRIGFNNSFIKSVRASNIKKLIYVACDPKANTNLVALCRPNSKAYQGVPFVPTRAQAFDMFPHTKFCELVLVYERLNVVMKRELRQSDGT